MGASLTEPSRVRIKALRVVNLLSGEQWRPRVTYRESTLRKASANSVPAAAVIQRWQALFGFTGRKASAGGAVGLCEILGLTEKCERKPADLSAEEDSGTHGVAVEMRRYQGEHQWRRRLSWSALTLRLESQGSEQD